MNYLFELSKEHKTLPHAEILACLQAENISYNILESNEDILAIETNSAEEILQRLASRLSFTFYINEFLFSCTPSAKKIKNKSSTNTLGKRGSIAIKYKNRSKNIDSRPVVKALAGIYTKDRDVTLENPDIEIRGLITDSTLYVGLKTAEVNRSQFEERKVQHRPFFSPISLHPKLARALVNLSLIKKDESLLDPFCGTGGILLEASLIGAKVIGSDIEDKMIEGCKKTLDFYKIKNYNLYCSDIGDIGGHINKVDAIVTDLPYGKSTTTKGEKMDNLYLRAFENMSKLLKEGGRAVAGLSNKDLISLGQKYLSLVENHDFRVHKSLIRHFVVFEK
jgi:tRNA (guanine10-N2)-dimethyltransferase